VKMKDLKTMYSEINGGANPFATLQKYKVGEVREREDGTFMIWYGISFVGTYNSRAEAEAFWAAKAAQAASDKK
jgi:hypothetical protein